MADASIDITDGAGRQKAQPAQPGAAQRQTDQMGEQLKPLFLYFLNQSAHTDNERGRAWRRSE